MICSTAFHLDCTPIIPGCGFTCGQCIEEMESVFGGMLGVRRFYRDGSGVVVEHDPDAISVEELLDVFRGLPSFYPNHFLPAVMREAEGQS